MDNNLNDLSRISVWVVSSYTGIVDHDKVDRSPVIATVSSRKNHIRCHKGTTTNEVRGLNGVPVKRRVVRIPRKLGIVSANYSELSICSMMSYGHKQQTREPETHGHDGAKQDSEKTLEWGWIGGRFRFVTDLIAKKNSPVRKIPL